MASAPRRSARARRPPERLADSAMASTPSRRRSARARRRPLPKPGDRAAASASALRRPARRPEAQTVLPDEIWEEIFLRLDAAADLARASAACASFRYIISERRFLRRLRSLRSPAALGFIGSRGFVPAAPPHRSAPEARALVEAADFTFSFLPDPNAWCFCHTRDGRVLLSRRISAVITFQDFVVCDPLHRRYVMIPRIPDDVLASAADGGMSRYASHILAPAGENDEEESFRVICSVQLKGKGVVVFVFSSCSQTWRAIISTIWLPIGVIGSDPCYVHGCLYWMFYRKSYSLVLDTSEMEFSIIDLPSYHGSRHAIVEAEEGRLRFLTVGDGRIDLYCKNWQSNGVGSQEWRHDKLIPLPKDCRINYNWYTLGTAGRYLTLLACHEMHYKYFVLDIKTSLLEELCTSEKNGLGLYYFPYARFPPPLAMPSI